MKRWLFWMLIGGGVWSCASENSPVMRPGENCQKCHDGGEAPKWTGAGTIFPSRESKVTDGLEGITIEIIDANSRKITLTSNAAGNFYTAEKLAPPLETAVENQGRRLTADEPPPSGDCNRCHDIPPQEEAKGRLYWSTD